MFKTMKQRLMARWVALVLVFAMVLGTAGNTILGIRQVAPGYWMTLLATLATIYLVAQKTTFLPFLGETVLPPSVLKMSAPTESTFNVTVKAPGRASHVIYWAAEPESGIISGPREAYGKFSNAGVVPVIDASATLPLFCPAVYKVPMKSNPLKKHVHYRAVFPEGILGEIKTQNVLC
jgi:hypothetical protein